MLNTNRHKICTKFTVIIFLQTCGTALWKIRFGFHKNTSCRNEAPRPYKGQYIQDGRGDLAPTMLGTCNHGNQRSDKHVGRRFARSNLQGIRDACYFASHKYMVPLGLLVATVLLSGEKAIEFISLPSPSYRFCRSPVLRSKIKTLP